MRKLVRDGILFSEDLNCQNWNLSLDCLGCPAQHGRLVYFDRNSMVSMVALGYLSFASLGFVGIEMLVTLKRNLGLDSSSVAPLTETTLLRAAKVVQFSQTWPLDETEKSPAVCDVVEYMLQW
jgi:hypothetical protein